MLAFFAVKPGQRVAELNGGWGYFSGLLSEVVGDAGKVYAHTTEASMKRWNGNPIAKRIEKYGIDNIEPVVGTMDAPGLPAGLDAVFMIMTYHDAVWSGADRPAMNQAIFTALKPGGTLASSTIMPSPAAVPTIVMAFIVSRSTSSSTRSRRPASNLRRKATYWSTLRIRAPKRFIKNVFAIAPIALFCGF
ncbi:MAG: hypothetical protein R3F24_07665 [Gammaproteobacteria bacterium]